MGTNSSPAVRDDESASNQLHDARRHGEGGHHSGPFEGIREASPPYWFGWDEMLETIYQQADIGNPDLYDRYSLSYVNPATGKSPLFPTMSFRAQLLNEGPTDPHFHSATEVYFVIDGEGATHVGNETLE